MKPTIADILDESTKRLLAQVEYIRAALNSNPLPQPLYKPEEIVGPEVIEGIKKLESYGYILVYSGFPQWVEETE